MMIDDDNVGQMIFEDLEGLKLPDIWGPSWSKKNISMTFPGLVSMALDFYFLFFLVVVILDASTGDFVVFILF